MLRQSGRVSTQQAGLAQQIDSAQVESTQQATPAPHIQHVQHLARVALLGALALMLSFVETMIPLPLAIPGVKLGLANAAVLVALYTMDGKSAAWVALIKVLAAGFLFGSPVMLAYSFAGTTLAFAGMLALKRVPWLEVVPVSMVAAILHNVGQLCAAALMLGSPAVFISMLPLGVAACVTGFLTGVAAQGVVNGLNRGEVSPRPFVDMSALVLEPGRLVAFVGPNGSGKTTAALQLAGLLKGEARTADLPRATQGAAASGASPASPCAAQAGPLSGARAGVAFQDPDDQIVALLVGDDIAFGLENQGEDPAAMGIKIGEALSQVGLVGLEARPVASLSGGQKQQVALAGLAVCSFPLLVVDEGSSMLDEGARRQLMEMLRGFCSQSIAVVMVTQFMDEAFQADTVAVFQQGRIVAQDTPAELLKKPDLLLGWGLELPKARLQHARDQRTDAARHSTPDQVPLLCCQNLVVAYGDRGGLGHPAVSGVNLKLHPGDVFSLTGPSGCGKTSLMRALAGELAPAEGVVLVGGANLWEAAAKLSPDQRRYEFARQVGLCPQMPERALFAQTAFDDVAFGPRNQGLPEDQVQTLVDASLSQLRLDPQRARRKASCFYSGGEQRRIALAAVLACQPAVLLLDEPTAGLDPVEREALMDAVFAYAAAGGAVLYATHDQVLAQQAPSGAIVLGAAGQTSAHSACGAQDAAGQASAHSACEAQDAAAKAAPCRIGGTTAESGPATSCKTSGAPASSSPKTLPFGIYGEGNTVAHGLHPGTKLVFCILLAVAGFCASGPLEIGALGLVSLMALLCARLSPVQVGRMLAPFSGLMVFVVVFDLFFAGGSFAVSGESVQAAVENVLRFAFVLLGTSWLLHTTSPTALSDGVHCLLAPFSRRSPWADDLSCALGLTFRFTPLLVDEFFQVKCAQQAKMARFDGAVSQRLKALVPVFTVLFSRALRRSDTLALSMVNRGYPGCPGIRRTRYRRYAFGLPDVCALLVVSALLVLITAL